MELELTTARVARIWWAIIWRSVAATIIAMVLAAIVGFLLGLLLALLGVPKPLLNPIGVVVGAGCGLYTSFVAIRTVLNRDFGPVRLALIPSRHETARRRAGFAETVPAPR